MAIKSANKESQEFMQELRTQVAILTEQHKSISDTLMEISSNVKEMNVRNQKFEITVCQIRNKQQNNENEVESIKKKIIQHQLKIEEHQSLIKQIKGVIRG